MASDTAKSLGEALLNGLKDAGMAVSSEQLAIVHAHVREYLAENFKPLIYASPRPLSTDLVELLNECTKKADAPEGTVTSFEDLFLKRMKKEEE